jgi:hypothetical protein
MFYKILEKGEFQVSGKEREQQAAVREEYARMASETEEKQSKERTMQDNGKREGRRSPSSIRVGILKQAR